MDRHTVLSAEETAFQCSTTLLGFSASPPQAPGRCQMTPWRIYLASTCGFTELFVRPRSNIFGGAMLPMGTELDIGLARILVTPWSISGIPAR